MAKFVQLGNTIVNVERVNAVHRLENATVVVILSNAHEPDTGARKGMRIAAGAAADGQLHLAGPDAEKAWQYFAGLAAAG